MDLVIATTNKGKVIEFIKMLSDKFDNIYSMKEVGITNNITEDGTTLEENAFIKARYVKDRTNMAVLADDTGLFVEALGGLPNIHTARFAGEDATDQDNRNYLLELMHGKSNRNAYFETSLVLILPSGRVLSSNGRVYGKIAETELGKRGFGYDMLFCPDELGISFAQASLEQKNNISHRYRAMHNLLAAFEQTKF